MLHRMIVATRLALGVPMLSMLARAEDDGETLGLIELDTNLADVEKPPELPPGLYTGEIQDVQVATSQKGNQYFNIKFHISPSEIPAEMQDDFEDGADMFYNRIIKPKGKDRRALFNLKNFVEKLGLSTDTTTIDPNEWMGQSARLKVVHGTYQGDKRAEIKSIEAADGVVNAPAPKKESAAPAKKTAARGRK